MRWNTHTPMLLLALVTACSGSDDGPSADGSGSGSSSAESGTSGTPPDPGATSQVSGNLMDQNQDTVKGTVNDRYSVTVQLQSPDLIAELNTRNWG